MNKICSYVLLFFCLCASLRLGAEVLDRAYNRVSAKKILYSHIAVIQKAEPNKRRNLLKPSHAPLIFQNMMFSFSPIFQVTVSSKRFLNDKTSNPLHLLRSPPSVLV